MNTPTYLGATVYARLNSHGDLVLNELAALGTGHIYCDLIRLRKRISTE